MLILTIRTDKPEAELGFYKDHQQVACLKWHADRQLAETIHTKIESLLKDNHYNAKDIEGIGVFQGPGSFTGLRIGISVANALAAGLSVPIAGGQGELWIQEVTDKLLAGNNQRIVMPQYGSPPHITPAKK